MTIPGLEQSLCPWLKLFCGFLHTNNETFPNNKQPLENLCVSSGSRESQNSSVGKCTWTELPVHFYPSRSCADLQPFLWDAVQWLWGAEGLKQPQGWSWAAEGDPAEPKQEKRSELRGLGALCRAQGSQGRWWPMGKWLGRWWPTGRWWALSYTLCWLTISYTTILTEQRQSWHETPRNNSVLLFSVISALEKSPKFLTGRSGELTLSFICSQGGVCARGGLQKCLKLWDVMEASAVQRQSLVSGFFMLLFVSAVQITIERLLLMKG